MTHHNGHTATETPRRATLTEREIAYLTGQGLGRIATVDAHGRPRLVATGFNIHPERGTIELGGFDIGATKRVEDIRANPHVSLIVDDVDLSSGTWHVRGVEIRGTAVYHPAGTPSTLARNVSKGGWMELTPDYVRSWGLE